MVEINDKLSSNRESTSFAHAYKYKHTHTHKVTNTNTHTHIMSHTHPHRVSYTWMEPLHTWESIARRSVSMRDEGAEGVTSRDEQRALKRRTLDSINEMIHKVFIRSYIMFNYAIWS